MSAHKARRNAFVGTTLALLLGGMGWAPLANVEATHDGSGWYSDAGLDTPDPPGTITAFGPNTAHGGPDGPAEPNFGTSRPGGDGNADGSWPVGGTATTWGNRTYAPICQNPDTYLTDPIPHFGEFLNDTLGAAPDRYVWREDVGNVSEMRNGDDNFDGDISANYTGNLWNGTANPYATNDAGHLFFDHVWFFGFPVGVNVNGAAQGQDNDNTGFSDPAEAYSAAFDPANATAPKKPRAWVSSSATPAFAIVWLGNWTDGADGAGRGAAPGGFRDNVINLTGVNATRNNVEWQPYRGAAPKIHDFFDPYNFVSIIIDPDNGIGQAIDGVDNITGDPPPIDPDSPGNDFQNNATNYVVGRVGFLSNPSNVTDNATEITNGITNFTTNPQQTNTTVTVDCEIESDYIQFRADQRYDSAAIYLIDDVPGRQVTSVAWFDPDMDNRTTNGTAAGGYDRVDMDQMCTDASEDGVDVVVDGEDAFVDAANLTCGTGVVSPGACTASGLTFEGAPSSHGATFDGAAVIRFDVGLRRRATEEVNSTSGTIATHNDAGPQHEWSILPTEPGIHTVNYEFKTTCPPPATGAPETFAGTFTVWSGTTNPVAKCTRDPLAVPHLVLTGVTINGTNSMVGTPGVQGTRFVVGFNNNTTMTGLSVGSLYNGGTIVLLDTDANITAVEIPLPDLVGFMTNTTSDPDARFCEADVQFLDLTTSTPPNDTLYSAQYGMVHTKADLAWGHSNGTTAKSVCIVDTGMLTTHEDLRGSRLLASRDVADQDNNVNDPNGHGTHVAGIAAATANNATGVAGMSQSGIRIAKVFRDSSPNGAWASDVAAGITWCSTHAGHVISMSIGGPSDAKAVREAVQKAWWDYSKVLVAAAGNNAGNNTILFPAKYPEVLAVTCTDENDDLCTFSRWGPQAGIAAPGNAIRSTCFGSNSQYCNKSGTSMSAPHVSGAAALIWSTHTSLTHQNVRRILQCTAEDLGDPGWDHRFGDGLLDVENAYHRADAGGCATSCSGTIGLQGTLTANGYKGAVIARVTHNPGAHVIRTTVTTMPSNTPTVAQLDHDQYKVTLASGSQTKVKMTAELVCGTTITKEWKQYN